MPLGKKKTKDTASDEMKKSGNASLLVGVLLAVVVFALIFISLIGVQQKTSVMVATKTIPPYTLVNSSDFASKSVPRDSVTSNDVSPSDFSSKYNHSVSTTTILSGQRLDNRLITQSSLGTLSVVKPTERVVGVSTTFPGSVAGSIQPGLVVDVVGGGGTSGTSGNVILATNAKVMGVGANAGTGITPSQPQNGQSSSSSSSSASSSQGGIVVLIAVPQAAATAIAGQAVSLEIVPNLCFDALGNIQPLTNCFSANTNKTAPPATTAPTTTAPSTGTTGTGTTTTAPTTGTTGTTTTAPTGTTTTKH